MAVDSQPREGPVQMGFGFPVLEGGYRPPRKKRRRRKAPVPTEQQIQFELELLLESVADPGETPWSIEEIKGLHMFLLERSLEVLADARTAPATVKEIFDWLCAIPTEDTIGFSFPLCCWLSGYDADELRELTLYEATRLHGITVRAA